MSDIASMTNSTPGFWSSFWQSATTFQFYRRIKDQPFGRSLRYLFILAACLSLLISIRVCRDFYRSVSDWAIWISSSIPELRIQNGIVSMASTQPKTLSDEHAILILDPFCEQAAAIDEKYRTGMALSKNKVRLKWNQVGGPAQDISRLEKLIYTAAYMAYLFDPQAFKGNEIDLSSIRLFLVNPDSIARWRTTMIRWVGAALPLLYFLFYLAGKLMQVLFFSLVLSYSYRAIRDRGFDYAKILNISIYALTPPALFAAIVQVAAIQVPYLEWLFLGMYVAFLMGALNACLPKDSSQQTAQDRQDLPDHWTDF